MHDISRNIRNLIRAAIFILVFILVFIFLSKAFATSSIPKEDGMESRISKAYRGEDKNSLDVIFVGNSDIYRAVSPVDLYRSTGIASAVAGEPNISIQKVSNNIHDILKYQKPKVLVLDTDCLFSDWNPNFRKHRSASAKTAPAKEKTMPETKNTLKKNKISTFFDKLIEKVENADSAIISGINFHFPLIKYHESWKKFKPHSFLKHSRSFYKFSNKGMVYSKKAVPFSSSFDYMNDVSQTSPKLSADQKIAFDEICRTCADNDIRLVLITVPSANTWNMQKSDAVQQLADKYGLPYYDYNITYPEGFDWEKHSKDGGNHLNYGGALTVTNDFGCTLQQDLNMKASNLTDRQKAQWEKDYKHFHEKTAH